MYMQYPAAARPFMPVQVNTVPVAVAPTPVGPYIAGQPLVVVPGCKKKCKKRDDSSDEEETIYIKRSEPKVIHKRIIVQQPPQPKIVIVPQPPPDVKNQQNPRSDVIVYAPQVIQANRSMQNYQLDDRDTMTYDYHPQASSFRQLNDGSVYDSRADNRVYYNRQNFNQADYRADQRSFRNAEDNRRFDYRADNRSNREDNRIAMAYNGCNGSYCPDDDYERGYYNGNVEAYNKYAQDTYDDYPYYPAGYYP